MRCLGIPNTAHFASITSIEDALGLWNKIQHKKEEERWNPETEVIDRLIPTSIQRTIDLF
jgi:splicing factor 3A subunit 3